MGHELARYGGDTEFKVDVFHDPARDAVEAFEAILRDKEEFFLPAFGAFDKECGKDRGVLNRAVSLEAVLHFVIGDTGGDVVPYNGKDSTAESTLDRDGAPGWESRV
ncbi:hypothetical protein DYB28_010532 [Aphanomyces astaci]|uniref:Uncharacterized protein n=1 Tax=Aphanomyces astaci TaxID=112090 RepID=A0A9X8E5I4_APHAT|nr:hypothetical protein DYB28_010532 [Aphanomyces astaci]